MLKVGLRVDEAGKAGEMQRRLDAQEKELESTKRVLERKEADVKEMARDCSCLELEQKSARSAIKRG